MKLFYSLVFIALCSAIAMPAQAAKITPLLKSDQSWEGTPIHIPAGETEISSFSITLEPGETMPFHCHPLATFGFVKSGDLKVETLGGKHHIFHENDVILEVVSQFHRGHNLSAEKPVELIVFYVGPKGTTHTILYDHQKECAVKNGK